MTNVYTNREPEPMSPEAEKMIELMELCQPVEAFTFEGVLFLGYYPEAIKEYVRLNPSKKFYMWLCDNYPRINEIKP